MSIWKLKMEGAVIDSENYLNEQYALTESPEGRQLIREHRKQLAAIKTILIGKSRSTATNLLMKQFIESI